MNFLLVSLTIFCILAILIIALVPVYNRYVLRTLGIYMSQFIYILSIFFLVIFDKTSGAFQFIYEFNVIPTLNINYVMGIDGISLFLIILTTFLTSICILVSWESVENHLKYFLCLLFLTQFLLLNAFSMLNLFFFFVSFEGFFI